MSTSTRGRSIAIAVALLGIVAACGSDDSGDGTTPTAEETTVEDSTEPETTEAPTTEPPTTEPPTTEAPTTEPPTTEPPTTEASTADEAEAELAALVEAAQAEGTFVWYCAPTENVCKQIGDAFTAKYGVQSEFTRLASPDLAQRYLAEAEAGNVTADLILTQNSALLDQLLADGTSVALADAGIPGYPNGFPEQFLYDERGTAIVMLLMSGIGYNTELVGDDPPTTWEDLLDPKYQGEILLTDPNSSESYIAVFDLLINELGEDYVTQLVEQDLRVVAGAAAGAQALGAGEGAIQMPALGNAIETVKVEGAPVEFVVPDLTTGAEQVVAISTDAPHPNAARLFVHFIMSEEGNTILNDVPGSWSPVQEEQLPADYHQPNRQAADQKAYILDLLGL